MNIRIGIGYDIHKLVKGRRLFLGGIEIPHERGLLGHSDGDVLLHAICDAILGACGGGDIGTSFPDTADEFKDIKSGLLLQRAYESMKEEAGCRIINIDVIVICDEPRLEEYKQRIKKSISEILSIEKDRVNIKGKTTERTSIDTISSYAVVLVEKKVRR